ncbi:MAG: hypothetical protein RL685_6320 [Pseudomonadota bacterium]|jgi:predicted dithiol-disulfide oxidoreductase (DUF899 family)
MTTPKIEYPSVVSRAEWLEARKRLLVQEKELTHARDRLNSQRRGLPMVLVDEPYVFHASGGERSLLDLFEGRLQLVVYHFMWLWEDGKPLERGCPSCSAFADELARGHLQHLHARSTTLALISRAPLEKIEPFRERMGWTVPWYSSFGGSFNFDYGVSLDESVKPIEYNYRTPAEHERAGSAFNFGEKQPYDLHGLSCFLRDGERVYHTYSSYARGTEGVGGSYYFLDFTALGRQEPWEKPKGRQTGVAAAAGAIGIGYPDEGEQSQAGGSCCD